MDQWIKRYGAMQGTEGAMPTPAWQTLGVQIGGMSRWNSIMKEFAFGAGSTAGVNRMTHCLCARLHGRCFYIMATASLELSTSATTATIRNSKTY